MGLVWFVVVVAAIPAVLWLLRRGPLAAIGAAGAGAAGARTVGVLALSPSQRVVTVEVGQGEDRRWLVLGVTPQGITTLHTMPPQAEAAAPGGAPGFAAALQRWRAPAGAAHPPGASDGR
jgi:flagellar protein FliO/FliZ